jgi:DNA topoisomerase-2
MKVSDFYNNELVDYASYSTLRMIASAIDGQKNAARKVLYTIIEKNIKNEIKVSQLNSKMAEFSEYLHGDASDVIARMAKEFPGSNNIPLLAREGNFGTRFKNDHSAPRYIYTYGSEILWQLFHKEDNPILVEQYFEGDKIEPRFYLPSLPLLLVNGSEGMATGFAQKILPRNPKNLKNYISDKLQGKLRAQKSNSLHPYYEGFEGTIIKTENPGQYEIYGCIERLSGTKVRITEIPVGIELKSYIKTLDTLEEKGFIRSYIDQSEKSFQFEVSFNRGVLDSLSDDQLLNKLKLVKTVTENYTAIDADNRVKVFTGAKDIIDYYYNVKIDFLQKRIDHIIAKIQTEIRKMVSVYLFIQAITEDKLIINKRKKTQIVEDLENFPKIQKEDDSYDYLLRMPIHSLTKEKMDELMAKIKDKKQELDYYKTTTPETEWLKDLKLLDI